MCKTKAETQTGKKTKTKKLNNAAGFEGGNNLPSKLTNNSEKDGTKIPSDSKIAGKGIYVIVYLNKKFYKEKIGEKLEQNNDRQKEYMAGNNIRAGTDATFVLKSKISTRNIKGSTNVTRIISTEPGGPSIRIEPVDNPQHSRILGEKPQDIWSEEPKREIHLPSYQQLKLLVESEGTDKGDSESCHSSDGEDLPAGIAKSMHVGGDATVISGYDYEKLPDINLDEMDDGEHKSSDPAGNLNVKPAQEPRQIAQPHFGDNVEFGERVTFASRYIIYIFNFIDKLNGIDFSITVNKN